MPRLHEVLARTLREAGVEFLFGLVGDANVYVAHSFADAGGEFVPATHEAGAVAMASGHAQVSGQVGVATVTHGPGVTNTITALTEAAKAGVPLILLAGDTAPVDVENLQNIDQRALLEQTGAAFLSVDDAGQAQSTMLAAIRRATVEHRPVVVNIGIHLQWDEVEWSPRTAGVPQVQRPAPDPAIMDAAVGLLASANRPLLIAGRGARDDEARREILDLADAVGAPVATTLQAKDLFRGESADLGIFGTLSTPWAVKCIQDADCILSFGASLTSFTTARGAYLEGKRVISCNTDPVHGSVREQVDVAVLADAAAAARLMREWLEAVDLPRRSSWVENSVGSWGAEEHTAEPRPMLTQVLELLDQEVASDRTVVTDVGRFMVETYKRLHVSVPSAFVPTHSFGSIGLGMGTAIGAALARRDRPTLLVSGDGGMMLGGLTELCTAERLRLDLTVMVCNDGSYGAEHAQLREHGLDPAVSMMQWPDLASVADSFGWRTTTISSEEGLPRLAEFLGQGADGPRLVDVRLDPDEIPFQRAH